MIFRTQSGSDSEFAYCPVLQELVQRRLRGDTMTGRKGKKVQLRGLSTTHNLTMLRRMCLERQPRTTLEIGMLCGGSTLVFAQSFKDQGVAPARQHVAIDPFQSTTWDDIGRINLEQAQLDDYVEVQESFSHLVLPMLLRTDRRFDLIYVDGSHLFEDVFVDFYYCAELLTPGGVVLFDDSADTHVAKTLRFLRRNYHHALHEISAGQDNDMDFLTGMKRFVARMLNHNQLTVFERTTHQLRRVWNAPLRSF